MKRVSFLAWQKQQDVDSVTGRKPSTTPAKVVRREQEQLFPGNISKSGHQSLKLASSLTEQPEPSCSKASLVVKPCSSTTALPWNNSFDSLLDDLIRNDHFSSTRNSKQGEGRHVAIPLQQNTNDHSPSLSPVYARNEFVWSTPPSRAPAVGVIFTEDALAKSVGSSLAKLSKRFRQKTDRLAVEAPRKNKKSTKQVGKRKSVPDLLSNFLPLSKSIPQTNEPCDSCEIFGTPVAESVENSLASFIPQDEYEDEPDHGSTIVVEESPVKLLDRKPRRQQRQLLFPTKVKNFQEPLSESAGTQLSDILTCSISQYASTQTRSTPSLLTPVSEWIHKDKIEDNSEINQFDSPGKRAYSEGLFKNRILGERRKPLLESFNDIKTHYDTSVRLFRHGLFCGQNDEKPHLRLVVRRVIERLEKLVIILFLDLNENKDRWIMLKPSDPFDIKDGACLKLYQPWQEVSVPHVPQPMIIGADVYKIVSPRQFDLTEERIIEITGILPPILESIDVSEPLFMDLVPYCLKNKYTVQRQTQNFESSVDIEVLILYAWKFTVPVRALIKDSDDLVSLLEVAQDEEVVESLLPGRYLKLKQVAVCQRVAKSQQLALFSVLHVFGIKQNYYNVLKWDVNSEWEFETLLDIEMPEESPHHVTGFGSITKIPHNLDCRISLTCLLIEKDWSHVVVGDGVGGSETVTIELVFGNSIRYPMEDVQCNHLILLTFLRIIFGKVIWDEFTKFEEVEIDTGSS